MPSYKVITDGAKLHGEAMPRIVREFQKAVTGKKITYAGYVDMDGDCFPIIGIEGGDYILAQCDDEGNGPGVLVHSRPDVVLCQTSVK